MTSDLYFLKRHDLFFRESANGYTPDILLAGLFDREAVDGYRCVGQPRVQIIPAEKMRSEIEEKLKAAERLLDRIDGPDKRAYWVKVPADRRSCPSCGDEIEHDHDGCLCVQCTQYDEDRVADEARERVNE